ncbi:hypothetical protein [Geotalea sp. SG265]|uniref:hypothetical protein n=1 Tax=Geotalea sp. SG265 TaxID=2922867 RepID=UPI001FAFD621|nr:hypothetical protein [Geotalea sp. SG265]
MENRPILPEERSILSSFILPDGKGEMVDVERFRQQRNLVVVFLPSPDAALEGFLQKLSAAGDRLAYEEAVVVVVHEKKEDLVRLKELGSAFILLADEGGTVIRRCSGPDVSVYITDRFREVFAVRRGKSVFSVDEVLEWLVHINRQCPE